MTPARAPADALRFANLLFGAATSAGVEHPVLELRVVRWARDPGYRDGGTNSGYFNDPEAFAQAAGKLDLRGATAVYCTLNPVSPSLLARANNRTKPRAEQTTADKDIIRRTWLLVDADPVRPSGIPSSDAEHKAALALVLRIRDDLTGEGWPCPVVADSGNGGHLLFRVDLPVGEETDRLVERVLKVLAQRYDSAELKVDTAVKNRSRISKVYGTTTRKGDGTSERPHRVAGLLDVPAELNPVPRDLLEALAPAEVAQASGSSDGPGQLPGDRWYPPRDLVERIERALIQEHKGKRHGDRIRFRCAVAEHEDREPSADWSRSKTVWTCRSCDRGGGALELARLLGLVTSSTQGGGSYGVQSEEISVGNVKGLTARTMWEGRRVVITLCQEGRPVQVDRVDPVSARSRAMLLDRLTKACPDLDDAGCKNLDRRLVDLAASGPQSSATDPDAPTVVDPDPEPWDGEVDGTALLDELVEVLGRYLVLPDHAAETIALWVVHTYAHTAFRYTPRLLLTSPDKRCGKSRLLSVICALVWRPLGVEGVTAAAMFRVIDAHRPTLLLDEADTYLRGRDVSEELRGVVNAGYARGGRVLRCVGDDHEPTPFAVFAPVVLAMIGRPRGTIEDRSIVVPMRRRTTAEPIDRLRAGTSLRDQLEHLRRQCRRWVDDLGDELAESDPQIPKELDDRAADNWLPLLALADAAGGPWPDRARAAAVAMTRTRAEGDADSAGVLLLHDLWDLFEGGRIDRLSTGDILTRLGRMDERPWPEFGRTGRAITAQQVATLLRPFGVRPTNLRMEEGVVKGYRAADLDEAWSRYTPRAEPLHATETPQVLGGQRCSGVAGGDGDSDTPPHVAGEGACGAGLRSGGSPGSESGDLDRQKATDEELETGVVELLRLWPRSCGEIQDAFHRKVSATRITAILEGLRLLGEVDCRRETTGHGQPREVWFLCGAEGEVSA